MHVSLNRKDTFCLYSLIRILLSFLISALVSGWHWWMKLTKIVLSGFGPFKGYHQGLLACLKSVVFKMSFESFWFFIKYTNTELMMIVYEGSESAQHNFGKFIHQFQQDIYLETQNKPNLHLFNSCCFLSQLKMMAQVSCNKKTN